MNDEQKMEILDKEDSPLAGLLSPRKKRGLELAGTGVGTFGVAWLAFNFAPMVLGAYGLFRVATGGSRLEAGLWLALGVGLYIAMPMFWPIIHIIKAVGLGLVAAGLFMLFKPEKN